MSIDLQLSEHLLIPQDGGLKNSASLQVQDRVFCAKCFGGHVLPCQAAFLGLQRKFRQAYLRLHLKSYA
jgi:hypothetical protein